MTEQQKQIDKQKSELELLKQLICSDKKDAPVCGKREEIKNLMENGKWKMRNLPN